MLTKEEIIKELRKITKENGGHTPAQKKFREITGIGPYELPKYSWANYGELVIEAGLTPNLFDNTQYEHEQLCKAFIKVCREQEKWPRRADLDIKRRKDSKFPASVTFYKQLGLVKTGDLPRSILEYVKDKRGYKDIENICNLELGKNKDINEPEEVGSEHLTHGWVYLIKHGNRNEYRIGSTTNLLRRLGENRIELPEGAEPIWSIETADKTGVEAYWLNRFKPKRMNGDWFNLSRTEVNEFKHWKKIY
jgi:hypothetical protein